MPRQASPTSPRVRGSRRRFQFGARSIATPDGQVWEVRRRWARRPRWTGPIGRRVGRVLAHFFDNPFIGDASWSDIGYGILFAAFIAFMIFVGLPALLFLLDAVYALLLIIAALLAHTVFGRPWTIEAMRYVASKPGPQETMTWQVHGWRGSLRTLDQVAAMLARGQRPHRLSVEASR